MTWFCPHPERHRTAVYVPCQDCLTDPRRCPECGALQDHTPECPRNEGSKTIEEAVYRLNAASRMLVTVVKSLQTQGDILRSLTITKAEQLDSAIENTVDALDDMACWLESLTRDELERKAALDSSGRP